MGSTKPPTREFAIFQADLEYHDHWLFRSPKEMPFALDEAAHESVNSIWRIALRLVSSGVSEADAERILSMQKISPGFMELDSGCRPWNRGLER
jgi:hypothetical protein